ncbi:hypothetical protein LY76DRAFT_77137 [Colletotrichum caudatum]|nr:hypothetical protein LY76DRAFT_77137 [Colletotrichum caudatum]
MGPMGCSWLIHPARRTTAPTSLDMNEGDKRTWHVQRSVPDSIQLSAHLHRLAVLARQSRPHRRGRREPNPYSFSYSRRTTARYSTQPVARAFRPLVLGARRRHISKGIPVVQSVSPGPSLMLSSDVHTSREPGLETWMDCWADIPPELYKH